MNPIIDEDIIDVFCLILDRNAPVSTSSKFLSSLCKDLDMYSVAVTGLFSSHNYNSKESRELEVWFFGVMLGRRLVKKWAEGVNCD